MEEFAAFKGGQRYCYNVISLSLLLVGDVNVIRFLGINQISLDGPVFLLSNHKYITISIYHDRHV